MEYSDIIKFLRDECDDTHSMKAVKDKFARKGEPFSPAFGTFGGKSLLVDLADAISPLLDANHYATASFNNCLEIGEKGNRNRVFVVYNNLVDEEYPFYLNEENHKLVYQFSTPTLKLLISKLHELKTYKGCATIVPKRKTVKKQPTIRVNFRKML